MPPGGRALRITASVGGDTNLNGSQLRHLPPWFAAIFGAVYVSGYLIEFFYYSSLGITDAGSELLKLKYVATGLTFFSSLLIISIPWMLIFSRVTFLVGINPNRSAVTLRPWAVTMILFTFVSVFGAVLLLPLQFFDYPAHRERWTALFVLTFVIIVGYVVGVTVIDIVFEYLARQEAKKAKNEKSSDKPRMDPAFGREQYYNTARKRLAQVLIVCIAVADAVIFWGRLSVLWSMLWPYGLFFVGSCVLIAWQMVRFYFQLKSLAQEGQQAGERSDESGRGNGDLAKKEADVDVFNFRYFGLIALGCLGSLVLFVPAVTSYAYVIFPFVPFSKGGADYEFVRRVSVSASETVRTHVDKDHVNLGDALILYTTTSSYYLATPKPGNDACDWRRHLHLPMIVQVARSEVSDISVKAEHDNCFEAAVTGGKLSNQ